jgi:tetratricopeptide (TPR) repeat protein
MHRRSKVHDTVLGILLGLSTLVVLPAPLLAQTSNLQKVSDPTGEAYRLFMVGRHLEREGDLDAAVQAYREAADLDPETGEILAELSSLYARRNEATKAIRAASDALKAQPDNLTAHRILGLVYAAQSGGRGASPAVTTQALDHLEKARGAILPDIQVELTLARLYLGEGRLDEGIELLETLLEDEVRLSEATQLLSEAYEEAGRTADAVAVVERAVASGRPSSRLLRRLGELYGRDDRWPEAIQAYESAVALDPRGGALRGLSDALYQSGQLEEARDALKRLTTIDPDDGASLYRLSQVELDLGNHDEAAMAAQNLMRAEPNGVRGPYALAAVHERRRDYQGVVDTLEPAIQTARAGNLPANQVARLLGQVGFAYEQLQDLDGAAGAYARATELLPSSLPFAARLARVIADGGDVNGGRQVLQGVLNANDANPLAHIALANFYNNYDRFDDAVEVLTSAQERFPQNATVLFQLGAVMEQHDRFSDAERAFREILDRDPEHADALNYLGYMLADRGERLQESVGLLERAIEIDPDNGAYLDSLGWAYFKLDRLELAETHLRQASEQMARNSVIQDHFGDVLFRLGRYDEAIDAWETALAGDGAEVESSTIERKMEDARQRLGR